MRARVVVAFALLVACEESTSGGNRVAATPDAGGGLASAVAKLVVAGCTQLGRCDAAAFALDYGDTAGCVEHYGAYLAWLVTLPDSGFSASGVTECAAQNAALDCAAFMSVANIPLACAPRGARKNGASCLDGSQCESGFCPSVGYACAACAPAPAAGAACSTGAECATGQACSRAGTCAVPAQSGQACGTSTPCDATLQCQSGTCKPLPATAGADCGSSTINAACDERASLVCSSSTKGKCIQLVVVGEGQACGTTASVARICAASGACVSGVCRAGPSAGQSCSSSSGLFCRFPDRCVSSVCVSPPSAEACP